MNFMTREFELAKTSLYLAWTEVWASVPKCHVCQKDESGSRRRRRVSWGSGQTCLQSKITANVKVKPSTVAPHHKRKAQQPNHFDHRHMAGAGCQAACRQSVTDGAVVSPPWCVLLWIWVALGWALGALNVSILFFFYCSVVPCTDAVGPLCDWTRLHGIINPEYFTACN